MTGPSKSVRMTSHLHGNSQASSQGQLVEEKRVTRICEDCEANFLKVLKERKIRKRGRKLTKKPSKRRRYESRDCSFTTFTSSQKGGGEM